MLVRSVDDQLSHELNVGPCHVLGIREDLGHVHRNTNLQCPCVRTYVHMYRHVKYSKHPGYCMTAGTMYFAGCH